MWSGTIKPYQGLSPRVRGNRNADLERENEERSIPACAGEPHAPQHYDALSPVYPRVCGGTGHRDAPSDV